MKFDPALQANKIENVFADVVTNLPVTVVSYYDHTKTLITTEAYNADGTPYAGNIHTLVFPDFFLGTTAIRIEDTAGNPITTTLGSLNVNITGGGGGVVGIVDQGTGGASPWLITGAVSQSGTWDINNISGVITLPTGAATEATLANVLTTVAFQARINTLGQKVMAGSTPVAISSDQSPLIANPQTAYSKTAIYIPVAQGAPGTTILAAASPGNKHKIIASVLSMSVIGTIKFSDGSGDLTGPMDVSSTGGFVLPAGIVPYQQTAVNSTLSLTTTLGKVNGVMVILTEP